MIFEEAFKSLLQTEIAEATGKNVVMANEIQYAPLKEDPDGIYAIMKGGNATKSNIPSYDLSVLPITVALIMKERYRSEVCEKLAGLIAAHNGAAETLTYVQNGVAVNTKYRAIYNTPYVLNGTYDLSLKTGTVKAVTVMMSIAVNYGENSYIVPSEYKLRLTKNLVTTDYNIDFVTHTERAAMPVYDTFQGSGNIRQGKNPSAIVNTFVFIIYAVAAGFSALQDSVIRPELSGTDTILQASAISLVKGNTVIAVKEYSFDETAENGTATFNVTFKI